MLIRVEVAMVAKTEAVASGTHAGCSKEAVATEAAADSSSRGTQWGLPARGFGPGKGKEFLLRRRACSAADDKVGRWWEGRGARCLYCARSPGTLLQQNPPHTMPSQVSGPLSLL